MTNFDLGSPTDVFFNYRHYNRRTPAKHRRFSTGAEAIQFVMESLKPSELTTAVVESDYGRFDVIEVREIYEGKDYPLPRQALPAVRKFST
jgi:hypothetical protein